MPNWAYLLNNFAYNVSLAIWIGGAVVLGALTAPALFRALPRLQAGSIFGPTLRKFGRMRLVTVVIAIAAAAVKHFVWEDGRSTVWIAIRWVALGIMAFAILYEIGFLERALEARRVHLTPEMPESDPQRQQFNVLHHRAESLMKVSVVAAVVALMLS
ncbi:MAG TPA: DUF4149 domain-containing protein [Thermoanaerobaculia bacterium]|jgi:hypothetical protein